MHPTDCAGDITGVEKEIAKLTSGSTVNSDFRRLPRSSGRFVYAFVADFLGRRI